MRVIIETSNSIYHPVALVSKKLLFTLGYKPGQYLLLKSSSGKTVVLVPRTSSTLRPDTVVVNKFVANILGVKDTDIGEVEPVYIEKPREVNVEVISVKPSIEGDKLLDIVRKMLVNKVVPTNKRIILRLGEHTLSVRLTLEDRRQTLVFITRGTGMKIVKMLDKNHTCTQDRDKPVHDDDKLLYLIKKEIASNLKKIGFTTDMDTLVKTNEDKLIKLDLRALKKTGGIVFEIWVICSRALSKTDVNDIITVKKMIDRAYKKPNIIVVVTRNASSKAVELAEKTGILLYTTGSNTTPSEIGATVSSKITSIFRDLLRPASLGSENGLFKKITFLFKPKTYYTTI